MNDPTPALARLAELIAPGSRRLRAWYLMGGSAARDRVRTGPARRVRADLALDGEPPLTQVKLYGASGGLSSYEADPSAAEMPTCSTSASERTCC